MFTSVFDAGYRSIGAPNEVLLSPGQDGWLLPSYILWVQVTSTGQFVEAAKGQHLPGTKAVRGGDQDLWPAASAPGAKKATCESTQHTAQPSLCNA